MGLLTALQREGPGGPLGGSECFFDGGWSGVVGVRQAPGAPVLGLPLLPMITGC